MKDERILEIEREAALAVLNRGGSRSDLTIETVRRALAEVIANDQTAHDALLPAFQYINEHRREFPEVLPGDLLAPVVANRFVHWAMARERVTKVVEGYALSYAQMDQEGKVTPACVTVDLRNNILPGVLKAFYGD